MERYERKNKGNPQRTPRSRSTMFPSLREEIDWWKYRSRSPLTFPQRYARMMGGIEREASFPRSTMVGEREKEGKMSFQPLGKKGDLL
jgi:hypothetical protein